MRAPGCGRLALPLLVLAVAALAEGDARELKEGETPGNFMEDEQWLSSISQYSGKIKHWNRFRDEVEDDYIKSWEDHQQGDEALDTTKDPCQKVKCSRHKVCIAQGYQRAMCISRKKLEHRIKQPTLKLHGNKDAVCKPCHMAQLASVCGSDGHTYSSVCKLEQQACLSSKQLSVRCEGPCPCPTEQATSSSTDGKPETCTGQDLADLGDRLRDWFQLLHENSKQNGSASSGASPASGLDKSLGASCKDSIGWMFSKLDTSADLFLDQMELAAINLDKYEVCIRPFFNSCDTYKDGRVSTAEWCFCFWREKPPCLAELERIQIQEAAKKKPGVFIPSCDEDGYYRKMQCDQSSGDCWCVDQLGLELTGTRLHGSPDCDDLVGFSGDFGSGVGWEDEEEKETEEAGEEAEEEEGEAGEADDGGYIWYSEKEGLQYWTSPGRLPGGMRLKLNSKIGSTQDKIPRGGTTSMRPSGLPPFSRIPGHCSAGASWEINTRHEEPYLTTARGPCMYPPGTSPLPQGGVTRARGLYSFPEGFCSNCPRRG